jgi:DNA-binding MarR family transcriptional regulator
VKALQIYLFDTFGITSSLQAEKEKVKKLPLYLRGNYNLYSCTLYGQKVIWAEVKNLDVATPDQLKKQSQALQEILGQVPVVYVFDTLVPWQRKRLIEKKVGFAEPFRQLYIPELFTQIRDGYSKEKAKTEVGNQLKPPAQLFLLYHLQVQRLEGLLLQEIADLLNYSAMTITRTIKELYAHALLHVEGTKEKTVIFELQGKDLWEKALPLMVSPVRETWYTDDRPNNIYTRIGGENALASYTMLAEPREHTIVIGKDTFRISKSQLGNLDKRYGLNKLEVWHYDPTLLSNRNEIDKLSLYLSIKDHEDERLQGVLKNMINEIVWL